ncbi:MAG: class I SAM-dependent methyltransferase [Candidatus Omnitrophica bacterium]|nr:class I SAM-dependent methyltransferase [Candidatus Omnitrophota bacterium]
MDFKERVRRRNEFDASLVYGTRKFNLMTRREEHLNYRKDHDNQWTDPKTGIIADKFSESRDCPLCGKNQPEVLFIKAGFPHARCKECDLVYANPILNLEEYKKWCSHEDSWQMVLETDEQVKMQSLEANYSLDIVSLYLENMKKIRICDIGCGPGTTLAEAKKRGFEVFGIEPNRRCHPFLEEKGIEYTSDFFPLKKYPNEKFDIILILNTLEHLNNPLQILYESRNLLKPKGLIYISVPSMDALVNRVLHEKGGAFAGHSHLQIFSILTLSKILEKAGFEVLEYETIITELGIIKNYLDFQHPYLGEHKTNFDFLTPELIYKNHWARNVNMPARLK